MVLLAIELSYLDETEGEKGVAMSLYLSKSIATMARKLRMKEEQTHL